MTFMDATEARAWELLEAECGKPLPFDVPTHAALSAIMTALSQMEDARWEAEYEYEVWQDGDVQAGGSAPDYASAKSEANHYAMMYNQEGPVEIIIYEKRRVAHARRSQRGKEVLS